jgi:hypothetical protein
MKTLNFLILLVTFAGMISCKKDDSEKFEPAGWFLAGYAPKDYRIGVDDQDAQHGQKSGYIESVVDTSHGFGTMMQSFIGDAYKGKRVRMTGYIQSLAENNIYSMMWARVDDYELQVTADFDNMDDRPLFGTNYWTKCEIVFDVPESPCTINYGLILGGIGKTWFDNVTFEIVDSTIPKTAYYLNEPFQGYWEISEDFPKSPVNLDFEE